jgi:hypothetical protein
MDHLVITLQNGEYSVEFVHWVEQEMDKTLGSMGFSRTGTTHDENGDVKLHYCQFCIAL